MPDKKGDISRARWSTPKIAQKQEEPRTVQPPGFAAEHEPRFRRAGRGPRPIGRLLACRWPAGVSGSACWPTPPSGKQPRGIAFTMPRPPPPGQGCSSARAAPGVRCRRPPSSASRLPGGEAIRLSGPDRSGDRGRGAQNLGHEGRRAFGPRRTVIGSATSRRPPKREVAHMGGRKILLASSRDNAGRPRTRAPAGRGSCGSASWKTKPACSGPSSSPTQSTSGAAAAVPTANSPGPGPAALLVKMIRGDPGRQSRRPPAGAPRGDDPRGCRTTAVSKLIPGTSRMPGPGVRAMWSHPGRAAGSACPPPRSGGWPK